MRGRGGAVVSANRLPGETYIDYFVRLGDTKDLLGMTWPEVAEKLNAENGEDKGACAYRKEYAAFTRGRMYEREQQERGVATHILALSDFHVPFNLPKETFADYRGVDVLVLNGDIQDCQSISKFPKTYRIPFAEEMIRTREYLTELVGYIQPKRVVVNYGNHEARLLRLLSDRLTEDVAAVMPDNSLELIIDKGFDFDDKLNGTVTHYQPLTNVLDVPIEYTKDWHCKVGKTIFVHPMTYSSSMLKTASKAVDYFLRVDRDFDCIVLGHTHKLGSYIQGGVTLYEQGCCCKTEMMNYTDGQLVAPQQQGFAYICQDADGNLIPQRSKIIQIGEKTC